MSPVNVPRFSTYLQGYDSTLTTYLTQGFSSGFRLFSTLITPPVSSYTNHPSVSNNPVQVSDKLSKELSLDRIAGPFSKPPFPNFVTSPLGLVPKKNSLDFRLVHDLSFHKDQSVNSHIDKSLTTVHFELLDDCLQILLSLGRGTLMAKADLKDAFRIIPIHPDDHRLLGFTFKGLFYYDRCLPMGCSISCRLFEDFSKSLQWILKEKLSVQYMSHILDDFIFFGPPSSQVCGRSLSTFFLLAESLGLPIKDDKTCLPSTCVVLHGIEVDSVALSLRLPDDKLQEAKDKVKALSTLKSVRLRELQSVLGTLSFACHAIVPGRAFLRRLFSLTEGISSPFHHVRLTKEAHSDLAAWSLFLESFNGRVLCLPATWESSQTLRLFTDASGSSFAAVLGSNWFQASFPPSWSNFNIAIKELLPISLAVKVWGSTLANKKVRFFTDNSVIVSVINTQSSKDPILMSLVRSLVLSTLRHNILFHAAHIPGRLNNIADFLSRDQVDKAFKAAPWLHPDPVPIPPSFLPW